MTVPPIPDFVFDGQTLQGPRRLSEPRVARRQRAGPRLRQHRGSQHAPLPRPARRRAQPAARPGGAALQAGRDRQDTRRRRERRARRFRSPSTSTPARSIRRAIAAWEVLRPARARLDLVAAARSADAKRYLDAGRPNRPTSATRCAKLPKAPARTCTSCRWSRGRTTTAR